MHGSVTAVVTTRNRLAMLRRAVGSILGQQDVTVRVVVVDEGSTDGTPEFLAAVEDPRVRVVRHDVPLGPSAARNAGVAVADADWIAVCYDDDVWSPTKMRSQLEALAARPDARWAVAGQITVDELGTVVGHRETPADGDVLAPMLEANVVPGMSGLVFQPSLFDEVGGFDSSLWASEDWDLEIRLAAAAPVVGADGPHVAYLVASGSLSNDAEKMRASFDLVRDRYADLAAAQGVSFDGAGYEEYVAHHQVRARRRGPAARTYAELAWRERNPRHAVRAATALVAPAWMDHKGDQRAAARVPAGWVEQFRRWYPRVPTLNAPPLDPPT